MRRAAHRLHPPDLHRRLGLRGLRRREPAVLSSAARLLQERLGLTDDELLAVLDVDPLTLLGGELPHRPEVGILLALTEAYDPSLLALWVRNGALDLLLARDFAGFEDRIEADLGGSGASY